MNALNEMNGFVKLDRTEEELQYEKILLSASRVINHGKLADLIMQYGLCNDIRFNQVAQLMGQTRKVNVNTLMERINDQELNQALWYYYGVLNQAPKYFEKSGVFFKENASGVKVGVPANHPVLTKYLSNIVKTDVQFQLTADMLTPEMIDAYSRVLIVSEKGNIGKFNDNGNCITGVMTGVTLNEVCRSLPLFDVMVLVAQAGLDMSILTADTMVHAVLHCGSVTEKVKENGQWVEKTWGTMLSYNPFEKVEGIPVSPMYVFNGTHGFFGVSNPDVLGDGMLKAFETYEGFLDLEETDYDLD